MGLGGKYGGGWLLDIGYGEEVVVNSLSRDCNGQERQVRRSAINTEISSG